MIFDQDLNVKILHYKYPITNLPSRTDTYQYIPPQPEMYWTFSTPLLKHPNGKILLLKYPFNDKYLTQLTQPLELGEQLKKTKKQN